MRNLPLCTAAGGGACPQPSLARSASCKPPSVTCKCICGQLCQDNSCHPQKTPRRTEGGGEERGRAGGELRKAALDPSPGVQLGALQRLADPDVSGCAPLCDHRACSERMEHGSWAAPHPSRRGAVPPRQGDSQNPIIVTLGASLTAEAEAFPPPTPHGPGPLTSEAPSEPPPEGHSPDLLPKRIRGPPPSSAVQGTSPPSVCSRFLLGACPSARSWVTRRKPWPWPSSRSRPCARNRSADSTQHGQGSDGESRAHFGVHITVMGAQSRILGKVSQRQGPRRSWPRREEDDDTPSRGVMLYFRERGEAPRW